MRGSLPRQKGQVACPSLRKFPPTASTNNPARPSSPPPDGSGHRRDVLLGTYGSAESRAEYARVLAEWESNGRRLPRSVSGCLTVTETILRYWRWAEEYYLDDQGNPGQELDNLKVALRPLRKLHGHTLA